ncbi:hypothetical protein KXW30_006629 [Aspergillus fumigatus]|nr:hypothetical protein KXX04_008664 [Aspergillus fumigatus]KAH2038587.1 hypothetical protein KXW85_000430 [Aspergillus fumigatus]KAH2351951.1 hypothetical protein KXW30_006629 [Aspergillus fumigatus]KAH2843136.1 hypothetical protein KXW08_007209 [Aspergillus fumigatus]KAH2893458.1 hypothetical protein KXW52_000840 [Aspergillus fumigatus]
MPNFTHSFYAQDSVYAPSKVVGYGSLLVSSEKREYANLYNTQEQVAHRNQGDINLGSRKNNTLIFLGVIKCVSDWQCANQPALHLGDQCMYPGFYLLVFKDL